MTKYADVPEGRAVTRRWPVPTNVYTVFLLFLNLAVLSVAFFDPKGIALLLVSLAFSAHVRLLLTQREAQRRTNELLEELLDAGSGLPPLR